MADKYGNYPQGPGNAEVLRRIQAADSQGLVDPVPGAMEMAAKYAMGAGPSWLRAVGALPGGESQDDVLQGVVPGPVKAARRVATAEKLGIPQASKPNLPAGGEGIPWPEQMQKRLYTRGLEKAVAGNSPLHGGINDRNLSYHATDLEGYGGILNSGEIKPLGGYIPQKDMVEDILQEMGTPEYNNPNRGVSVSRVPRVASKGDKPITLAIDNTKMPPTRPFAEHDFQKMVPSRPALVWQDRLHPEEKVELANIMKDPFLPGSEYSARVQELYQKTIGRPDTIPARPNPQFEFENRTYNKSIPASAIKRVMVDRKALAGGSDWVQSKDLEGIHRMAGEKGLPVEEYSTGRDIHSSPAGLTRRVPRPLP